MEFLFMALAVGCLAFLAKIVMDYMKEAPEWVNKTRQAEEERDQHEAKLNELVGTKAGTAEKAKTIGDEIKSLASMRDELKAEIEKTKQEMARKGRIIMNRQNPDQ